MESHRIRNLNFASPPKYTISTSSALTVRGDQDFFLGASYRSVDRKFNLSRKHDNQTDAVSIVGPLLTTGLRNPWGGLLIEDK